MRIRFRYTAATGILTALFSLPGPAPAQASQIPGTPLPATSHYPGIVNQTVSQDPYCAHNENCRSIFMRTQVSCDHGDANPFNAHGWKSGDWKSLTGLLSPRNPQWQGFTDFNYNGGGYFIASYPITVDLVPNGLDVNVKIRSQIIDVNPPPGITLVPDIGTPLRFSVPPGAQHYFTTTPVTITGTGYHNGPCTLKGVVWNSRHL
jgi:hypothetical protein